MSLPQSHKPPVRLPLSASVVELQQVVWSLSVFLSFPQLRKTTLLRKGEHLVADQSSRWHYTTRKNCLGSYCPWSGLRIQIRLKKISYLPEIHSSSFQCYLCIEFGGGVYVWNWGGWEMSIYQSVHVWLSWIREVHSCNKMSPCLSILKQNKKLIKGLCFYTIVWSVLKILCA